MINHSIDIIGSSRDALGECPLWDDRKQILYWIDSHAHLVKSTDLKSACVRTWKMPSQIGAIALCESGRLLVAEADSFHFLDTETGEVTQFVDMVHPAPNMRLNDGRVDREGRFVIGSMALGRREPVGELYQLDGKGSLKVLETGICVANSTCFSPDGKYLYFSDSLSDQLRRYRYDSSSGSISGRTRFVDTTSLKSGPDGATIDAHGNLWAAMVISGQLARFRRNGRLDMLIDLPTVYPSCPCIGGRDLDTIFVTSISNSGNALRSENPNAGAVVAIKDTGVKGLVECRFNDL
ncbi:SMP-30/gluconolactonase/LRE family protein [Paraburkholderia tropica]|uniref:Sugar lactone lactonase YvrE n=1 Tax=Paraburkholderia tropica TaxID=92647 RepID=A0ABX5MR34_9BURK|nr:SMP-30/gluconolactonase/LRE family protein [Paraburkholderia tropica]PXX16856.1 sugar lactone lactonase YvrE [Paraburkholderia tropica]PZW84001.1 sugar lactone lactonase YvrE [Paraburkholderia tropica]